MCTRSIGQEQLAAKINENPLFENCIFTLQQLAASVAISKTVC
jgi:hypothetical protein